MVLTCAGALITPVSADENAMDVNKEKSEEVSNVVDKTQLVEENASLEDTASDTKAVEGEVTSKEDNQAENQVVVEVPETLSNEQVTTTQNQSVTITDCGHFNEATWAGEAGAYSVGWKYGDSTLNEVTQVVVGAKDSKGRVVLEYSADKEQLAWQQGNGYITAEGLSSVPFYKEYNGTPIKEGRDSDWTATKGVGFDTWQPSLFYIIVTMDDGTVYTDTMEYNYDYPHIHELTHVAAKAPTYTEDGNIEYWICNTCNKLFSDEACTNEITLEDTVLAKLGHNYENGECTNCGEKAPNYQKPNTGGEGNKDTGTKEESKKDSSKSKRTNTSAALGLGLFGSLAGTSATGAAILAIIKRKKILNKTIRHN